MTEIGRGNKGFLITTLVDRSDALIYKRAVAGMENMDFQVLQHGGDVYPIANRGISTVPTHKVRCQITSLSQPHLGEFWSSVKSVNALVNRPSSQLSSTDRDFTERVRRLRYYDRASKKASEENYR